MSRSSYKDTSIFDELISHPSKDILTEKDMYCIAMHIQDYVKKRNAGSVISGAFDDEELYYSLGLRLLEDTYKKSGVKEGHYKHPRVKEACITVGKEFYKARFKIDEGALPCMFCKYESECCPHPSKPNEYIIDWWHTFSKLSKITGVTISPNIDAER